MTQLSGFAVDRSGRMSAWLAGLIMGLVVGTASVFLPIVNEVRGEDGAAWWFSGVGQFGALMHEMGWGVVGTGVALLGMVVAIVAFVGMREVAVGSQRRRELLIDSASYLILLATGLFTIVALTILLSVVPAPLLSALATPGASITTEMTLGDPSTADALRVQTGQVLLGFVAMGLLAATWYLDATVRVWSADDVDHAATEKDQYATRLRVRQRRVMGLQQYWSRLRATPRAPWAIRFWSGVETGVAAVGAAVSAAAAISVVRLFEPGYQPDWTGLAVALSLISLLHVLIVGPAVVTLLTVRFVEGKRTAAGRRWLLVGAMSLVPVSTALMFLASPDPTTVPTLLILLVLLFVSPTLCWCLRRDKYSWHELALLTAIKTLPLSIADDQARLSRLGVVAAPSYAVPETMG